MTFIIPTIISSISDLIDNAQTYYNAVVSDSPDLSITPFIQKINIYRTFFRIICNSSAFGRTVTESNPLEVRFAKDWIHSWQNLHVLTYFAVNTDFNLFYFP